MSEHRANLTFTVPNEIVVQRVVTVACTQTLSVYPRVCARVRARVYVYTLQVFCNEEECVCSLR